MSFQKIKLSSIHSGERYSILPPDTHGAYTFVKVASTAALLTELNTRIEFDLEEAGLIEVYAMDRPAADATDNTAAQGGLALGDWEHYKRGRVRVLGLPTDDATGQEMAYFYVESTHTYWVRPVRDFYETVENDDGAQVQRFIKVS